MVHHKPEQRSNGAVRKGVVLAGLALAVVGVFLIFRPIGQKQNPTKLPPGPIAKAGPPVWFENVAAAAGIDFRHDSGAGGPRYLPEIMVGGVCLLDYDKDGLLDVYFVQGGRVVGALPDTPGNQLYRNRGDGTFVDVTAETGTGDVGYGMGCTCADYNNDGWPDLYVTNYGSNVLYRHNGSRTAPGFVEVSVAAGVAGRAYSASSAFFDYDRDGDLDLFVVNYVRWSPETEQECRDPGGRLDYCPPRVYGASAKDTLYRNNGNGTFTDVTREAGIDSAYGNGLGIVCADLTGDGWVDCVVANDATPNQLWVNRGDGTFEDQALETGAAYNGLGMAEAGMGIEAQDVDNDGDLDLYMSHFEDETNTLYVNDDGFFLDRTARFGLTATLPFTGFGTALIDFNHDGRLDNYVANGRVLFGRTQYDADDPYAQPNVLFEGRPDGTFAEVKPAGGTAERLVHSSRGAAFGDYDNDGDMDIFVVNRDGPAYVLKNVASKAGHWIMFQVLNEHGSDALGARVTIEMNGQRRIRDVRPAYSYCSSNDPRVHFGLGAATGVGGVHILWPDGSEERFGSFDADQLITLHRGGGQH